MAWEDPYHARSHVFIHQPEIVYAAQVSSYDNYDTSVFVIDTIYPTSVTTGTLADIKPGMTLMVGSAASTFYWDDRGRVRVIGTGTSPDKIYVWASHDRNDGELYLEEGGYITVLDEYRLWAKIPYAEDGSYWYDGTQGPAGATYDQLPIANTGPAYAGFINSGTGLITVSFDASDSFAVADDAVLGGLTSGILGIGETLTASSGTPANATDGNTATYWGASTDSDEWIQAYWGGTEYTVRKFEVTGHDVYSPTTINLQWNDGTGEWITAFSYEGGSWGSTETRTFYVHHAGAHPYWRVYCNNGSTPIRIRELQFYAEDRTAGTSPYSWDVGDGTITVGSSTSESITATFPRGFRYVELEVTDTNAASHVAHVPVFAAETPDQMLDQTSATYDGTIPATAPSAFDGNTTSFSTASFTPPATAFVEITYAEERKAYYYTVLAKDAGTYRSPKDWTLEADGVVVSTVTNQTDWGVLGETRTFYLDAPTTATTFSMIISDANDVGATKQVGVYELVFYGINDPDQLATCEITSFTMEPAGQVMELSLLSPVSYQNAPDGALVMMWEQEYYDLVEGSLSLAGPTGREHMKFVGWIDDEQANIEFGEFSGLDDTALRCVDAGQRLRQLKGFTLMAERDAAPGTGLGYQMAHANMDTMLYLILQWLSTAAEVTDFNWSHTLDHYGIGLLAAPGASIYDMMNGRAAPIAHRFTCSKHNHLRVRPDPLLAHDAFDGQIETKTAITTADWTTMSFTRQRAPRYHWNWGSGVTARALDADDGAFVSFAWFAVSPGKAPGQGVSENELGEQLAPYYYTGSTTTGAFEVRTRTGKQYAKLNNPWGVFSVTLAHGGDRGYDPAEMAIVRIYFATTTNQRGRWMNVTYGVINRITIDYNHEYLIKTVTLEWEPRPEWWVGEIYSP